MGVDLKPVLRAYIVRFPGSFVGFLETVSDILRDLGTEWLSYGFHAQEQDTYGWGNSFLDASREIRAVAGKLEKLNAEHDVKFANPKEG